jgi:hypothetical protein
MDHLELWSQTLSWFQKAWEIAGVLRRVAKNTGIRNCVVGKTSAMALIIRFNVFGMKAIVDSKLQSECKTGGNILFHTVESRIE